ncbi:hypothetical protein PInf_003539 [Phytophthora infestans]|nr:hypothetical protein PInf_003539 [Phytophthora infestans]
MFLRTVRSHAKLGAAALMGAPMLLHSRKRMRSSHENVVVLDLESELIQLGMTRIRDYENAGAKFTHDANGVLRSTLDLALTELPNDEEAVVTTPRGYKAEGLVFEDDVKVCGISIAVNPEAHKGLSQVLRTSLPYDAKYGEILVQEAAKGGNKIAKASLPEDLDGHEVLLLLPELASVSQIDKVIHAFDDARLVTASFDSRRNNEGHIVPGIGSFEERYLGAPSSVVDVVDEAVESSKDENALKAKITSKISSWFKKD